MQSLCCEQMKLEAHYFRKEMFFNVGKFVDLSGKRFGHLLVERRGPNHISSGGNSFVAYECVCDCGNRVTITANKLTTGHTSSCGKCNDYDNLDDLTGRRFDKLVVIRKNGYHTYPNGDREYKWLCKCDCGGTITMLGKSLKADHPHSCNCWRHSRSVVDNMLDREFGRLTVIGRESDIYTKEGTVVDCWKCRCTCGGEIVVRGASLRNGHTSSCGCYRLEMLSGKEHMSKSEEAVANILDKYALAYTYQKTYPDLLGLSGNLLSYDFGLDIQDDTYLIECQGLQHYQPVEFFGGNAGFGYQKVHDYRKYRYADEHDFHLLLLDCRAGLPNDLHEQIVSFLKL